MAEVLSIFPSVSVLISLMAKERVVTQENFEMLLTWLDHNREIAAEKYEKIRRRLIRIFSGRGCFEAEELADETFNRVTNKLPQLIDIYTGEPSLYFYGVADKLHLEWLRKQKKTSQLHLPPPEDENDKTKVEVEYSCLETCLKKLPDEQHEMIVEYYRKEKSAKIENRRILAETFGISINALQVKISRLRSQLRECVQKCVTSRI